MGLSAKKAYGAAKAYTDETVIGGGALKGKNCVINSITDISATSSHPAGKRVNFGWTLDDGTEQSSNMDIFNGNDGEGIDHMYVNAEGHLIVVYDSGDEEDCGEITIPSSQADWNETDPTENSYIQNKPNISAIIDAVGNNTNAIGAINQQLSAVISGVSDNTSAIASINQQLSTVIAGVSNNTSAINTINLDLAARANIKTIGSGLNLDSSGELTATGGGGGGGSVNSVKMNNGSPILPDANGVVDLGTVVTDVSAKADKVTSATSGNFAGLDSNGNLTDSGSKASDFLTSHQDISGKADKVTSATENDLAKLDSNGNLADSGIAASNVITKSGTAGLVKNDGTIDETNYVSDISGKADKVSGATNGNFAGLDSNGNLTDSGSKASDFLTSHQDISGKANLVIVATVEASTTASKAYSVGDRLILNGVLYKATDAITSGGTIVTSGAGANVTETTIDAEIAAGGGSGHDATKADLAIIAPNFSDQIAYSVGEYVAYNGALYKCTTAHAAGAWDANDFTAVTVGADKQNKNLNTAIYIDGYPRTDIEALFGAVDTVLDHDKISGHNIARKSENSTYYPGQLYQVYDAMYGTILFYLCIEEFTGTPGTNPNSSYFERVLPTKLLGQRVTAGAHDNSSVGKYATAEGYSTRATGHQAHAEGIYTEASGYTSHAGGASTIAQRATQTVIGKCNIADTEGNSTGSFGKYVFIIGNGADSSNRSNAFTVDWDGNVEMAGHSNDTHVDFTISAVSSLPVTVYSDDITADMKVVNSELSTPSAILSDLTVTTAAGSCTVSGTISGTTDITLQLARVRAITVSTTQP